MFGQDQPDYGLGFDYLKGNEGGRFNTPVVGDGLILSNRLGYK